MKTFLPLCAAALLLAVSLPLSAAPDGDRAAVQRHELETQLQLLENNLSRQMEGTLRDEMGTQFQHLERKLSGQVEDAALATARQERRLTELENELHKLQEERKDNDSKRRQDFSAFAAAETDKVKAASDRYTTLMSYGFALLSVLTPIVLAVPIFLGYLERRSFAKEAENKLAEMNQKLDEMESLVAKGQQHEQDLNNLLQSYKNTPQDGFPANITKSAENAVKNGTGVEALRGAAVLAQNAKDWERACLYWEDVIKQDSQDEQSRFYLAFCQVQLGINPSLSKEQRKILLDQAEDYYQSRLPQTTSADLPFFANLRISYAMLKEGKATYASSKKESSKLLAEAYNMLREVDIVIPNDVNILFLMAGCRYTQSVYANESEREQFLQKRKELFEKILILYPQNILALQVLSTIYAEETNTTDSIKEKKKLLNKALRLLNKAKKLNPQNAKTLKLLSIVIHDIAQHYNKKQTKEILQNNCISTLEKAMQIAPQDVEILKFIFIYKIESLYSQKYDNNLDIELQELFDKIYKLSPPNAHDIICIIFRLYKSAGKNNTEKHKLFLKKIENLLSHIEKVAPFDSFTLKNFAAFRIEQAREAEAQAREDLLQQAEDYLNRLNISEQETAIYNRACIAALRGQPEKALELLEECRLAGTLPSREDIESDKDMDSLRDQDAFKKFMERAFPTKDDTKNNE